MNRNQLMIKDYKNKIDTCNPSSNFINVSLANGKKNRIQIESKKEFMKINIQNLYSYCNKLVYSNDNFIKEIQIFGTKFLINNIKKLKIIIKNKNRKINIDGKIRTEMKILRIKIIFLDRILYLNSLFNSCDSLLSLPDISK